MMARQKLLTAGLKQAGVKGAATRKRIRTRIATGTAKPGILKRAGVKSRSDRKIIKGNIAAATATRAKRAKRAGPSRASRVAAVLPTGTRGKR